MHMCVECAHVLPATHSPPDPPPLPPPTLRAGMLVDALLRSLEDRTASSIYKKILVRAWP